MFALLLVLARPAGEQSASIPRIDLPAGSAAEAFARVAADSKPAELPRVADEAWSETATWRRFAELLSAEAHGAAPDPARRAELALLALAQHRFDDAWSRFAECGSSPATIAALLPHFLPGIPLSASGAEPLRDGGVLTPALPPRARGAESAERGRVERRSMKIQGLRIGDAVVAVRVSVEGEGVEIDVEHVSGGAAKIAIRIPEEPQFAFADEYVDWFRQEKAGVPHAVELKPGDEAHTIYGRFEPRKPEWPTLLPEPLPAQLEKGALLLDPGRDAGARPLLQAVADCLSAGPLHLRSRVLEAGGPGAADLGVRVDLGDAAARPRKLAWIAGAVERRALAPPR